jgi:hypothetical protein
VRDANVFRDSQASIETTDLTFTIPLLSSYERGTMSGEVWSLTCERKTSIANFFMFVSETPNKFRACEFAVMNRRIGRQHPL